MTIGNELDQAFYNLGQRLTRLEKKETQLVDEIVRVGARSNADDLADKEMVLGIEAGLTSQIEMLESELNDRIVDVEGFDPDDLRCDLESQIEEVSDNWSYLDDRVDDIDCMKITEDEARDIAQDVVREEISDVIGDYVEEAVCHEINTRAVGFTEYLTLCDRVRELEDRLNKPSLGARAIRWLREGPSIKEVATSWYAGIRRGS